MSALVIRSAKKSGFIAGADDHPDLLDAGAQDFLDDDGQRGLGDAIAVDFVIMLPLGPQLMRAFNINTAQFNLAVAAYA